MSAAEAVQQTRVLSLSPATSFRCVIADDDPRLRRVLVRFMRSEGFRCVEAGSGREALDALAAAPTAMLLTDLRMPELDGMELVSLAHARHPELAIILITAIADVEVALQALSAGAMDYITKPFRLDEIRARVSQAMEKRCRIIESRSSQLRLEKQVAEQGRRIETLYLGAIRALVHALEVKDPYTRGHSIRVSRYLTGIARRLGLDDNLVRQVEIGGHVHDIGKIAVREEILNKEGTLTDAEYAHVMSHPVVGWQILAPIIDDSPHALNIVRSHHERFDGKGVPDGLRGDSIPLEARLCSVADAFDAMTSGRAYRRVRMSRDDALAELERHKGLQFDPEIVDEFVDFVKSDAAGVMGGRQMPTAIPALQLLRSD